MEGVGRGGSELKKERWWVRIEDGGQRINDGIDGTATYKLIIKCGADPVSERETRTTDDDSDERASFGSGVLLPRVTGQFQLDIRCWKTLVPAWKQDYCCLQSKSSPAAMGPGTPANTAARNLFAIRLHSRLPWLFGEWRGRGICACIHTEMGVRLRASVTGPRAQFGGPGGHFLWALWVVRDAQQASNESGTRSAAAVEWTVISG
ncbi:hypothetical protein BDK51DRAFT_52070 [Blyttiomyces helicus]|uniref:Uncharacterized protein n=1 Tax=Blyttiomyces helicus TaxID=388810 RepID=A0A4P9VYB3_9FUNG|nr:hypothetical protein BDK51DRAFT_52070 [Blyttiomyces helicus]|eukprot:RKO84734.1 hypothetical protein BDK51DRAFT_52070 [Blyttiomyces helicus]